MVAYHTFGLLLIILLSPSVKSQSPNVAFKKTVVGSGQWLPCAVDGNFNTTFSPYAVQFPYYYVDLGAVYSLTSINLFCQNEWSFYNSGVDVPFDVHTYDRWMSECGFEAHYPWDPLASSITFKNKGEEIVLKPTKPVRYIIIGQQNMDYPNKVQPIVIGEIQAHGEKLRESPVPQVPEDNGPIPVNYYKETRRAILGSQDRLWIDPGNGYFVPNYRYKDVVLGWLDQPKAMAVIRRKARLVVIMGHALSIEIDYLPMYTTFRRGLKEWLTNGSTTANYVKINAIYKPGDILLITRDDKFEVSKIFDKLISGENYALVGYPSRDVKDSVSELLEMLDIEFVRTDVDMLPQFVPVSGSAASDAFIPTSHRIERFVKSWKAFSTERFQLRTEELGFEQKDIADQVKALVEKYGALMEYLGPCDTKTYSKDTKTEIALINYNLILKYQHGRTGFVLPNVNRHPGIIPSATKPTTVVATVYADVPGSYFPLGVYAKPGEGFSWTVLKNTDETYSNQRIRINAQTDWIDHHPKWRRWPTISTEIYVKKQGQYISPHGGPLFLQLPHGILIEIEFTNVYRYPFLDLRDLKSVETFGQEVKAYSGVPWLVIRGDSMNSMLRTIDIYNTKASEVIESARHFDKAIKVMYNYRGSRWEEVRSETFAADLQISTEPGHAGYPWMSILSWSWLFTYWSNSIKQGGQPGFVKVIGLNLQVGDATLKGGEWVTNCIYRLLVEDVLLGLSPYQGDLDTGKWSSSEYTGPGLGYYRYLGKLFGYGLVGNGFMEARKRTPLNESDKTQFWVKQMCLETGYNLVPFHKMWNFPISDETQKACKALPCYFPDDENTKKFQSKVDAVLKEVEGKCSRSDQKKVQFRGEIKRGVDTVRARNIFLAFK